MFLVHRQNNCYLHQHPSSECVDRTFCSNYPSKFQNKIFTNPSRSHSTFSPFGNDSSPCFCWGLGTKSSCHARHSRLSCALVIGFYGPFRNQYLFVWNNQSKGSILREALSNANLNYCLTPLDAAIYKFCLPFHLELFNMRTNLVSVGRKFPFI